ncbi:MAG: hypothetical protein H6679_02005 [Epsilonproteobacteria bacterium]|nr:hypothetical protein [Campylobacterota bacterium]
MKVPAKSLSILLIPFFSQVFAIRLYREQADFIDAVRRGDRAAVVRLFETEKIVVNNGISLGDDDESIESASLVIAVKNNDPDMTRLLLSLGADPLVYDQYGELLIFWAHHNDVDVSIVNLLIEKAFEEEPDMLDQIGQVLRKYVAVLQSLF